MKLVEQPKISIVIPTYNSAEFIGQALQSVFEQAYDDIEIIIVDDGSTDNTAEILAQYGDRLCVITQQNAGSAAARNTGLSRATGKYVVLLDADDWLLPGKFHKQVAMLEARPSLGAVHSGWRIVEADGALVKDIEPWHEAPKLDLDTWLKWKPVKMGAMLYRRDWLAQVGYLDPHLRQSHDVDLMLRLALAGCEMVWLHEPTLCYRHHGNSTIRSGALDQAKYALMALDQFYENPNVPARIRRRENNTRYYSTMWVAWHLLRTGNAADATPYLKQTRQYAPFGMRRTVQDWLRHFTKWSVGDGADPADVRLMWPYFQQAAEMDDAAWSEMTPYLDWWLDVWWYYLQGAYGRAAQQLAYNQTLTARELVSMVQFYLIVSPIPATLAAVNQFWQDAQELGLVSAAEKHEVTALYLTLFGQALLAKEGHIALPAVGAALRAGYMPKAWAAWGRFMQAGLAYFSDQPWQTDKKLVNWTP